MKFVSKNQGGFTLLELLVVVGIIAIIGGAMLSSFSGQETTAARGVATNTIAGVENAMRIYKASTKGNVPNNMESLVCAPYLIGSGVAGVSNAGLPVAGAATDKALGKLPATALVDTAYKFGGTSNASGVGGGMTLKLAEKFTLNKLSAIQAGALNDVGVTNMRYGIAAACDTDVLTETLVDVVVNGVTASKFGSSGKGLVGIDITNQAFEDPRPNGTTGFKHRGVGFSGVIELDSPVLFWYAGDAGYNNTKLGAGADDVLVGMGLGQASDLVGNGIDAAFGKAPFYGQVGKDKYAHYIALINIGPATGDDVYTRGEAHVAAVVDARGDFLDEEMAEFLGQKK